MADVPRLGARGGGWVALQFTLMGALLVVGLLASGWPDAARWWLKAAAVLLIVAGGLVLVRASVALGSGLTPFPRPAASAELVETGPYAVVRHPIYSGGLLIALGLSLALSPWALVPAAALAVVWALKANVEEGFLRERYPGYAAYCRRTRYRLVPFVY